MKKGIAGSYNRKSRDLEGETADQFENSIGGSWNRKSRDLEGETADQFEKGSWAQGEVKPRRKVQSPILGTGVILGVKTTQN